MRVLCSFLLSFLRDFAPSSDRNPRTQFSSIWNVLYAVLRKVGKSKRYCIADAAKFSVISSICFTWRALELQQPEHRVLVRFCFDVYWSCFVWRFVLARPLKNNQKTLSSSASLSPLPSRLSFFCFYDDPYPCDVILLFFECAARDFQW